jgi:exodeoxyribonuclease VII small subunit
MEDIKDISFEEGITKLEEIVKELESGNVGLDESIKKYTEGMQLAKLCGDKLNSAEEKINKILKENGSLENFDIPSE